MASVPPIREPADVVEDGSPTNSFKIERAIADLKLGPYHVRPYKDTCSVTDAMYAIGVVGEP